jgi:hypothetical protein
VTTAGAVALAGYGDLSIAAVGHGRLRRRAGRRSTASESSLPPRRAATSRVLAELAGGHADRTWPRRLAELARPALLILDDFAMREFTAPQADDLYELVSERTRAGYDWLAHKGRCRSSGVLGGPSHDRPVKAGARIAPPRGRGYRHGRIRPGQAGRCRRRPTVACRPGSRSRAPDTACRGSRWSLRRSAPP